MVSTLEWLRSRDDAALRALLRARPDLLVPTPADLTVLAGRLNTGPSVWRALEQLDRFHLQVVQAAVLAQIPDADPVPRARVADLVGTTVPAEALDAALLHLESVGLVRGTDPVTVPSAVTAALGQYPAGLGPPGPLSAATARRALDSVSAEARSVLERLDRGLPRGSGEFVGAVGAAVDELLAAKLLTRIDPVTVEMPRQTALALRGDTPLGRVDVTVPPGEQRPQRADSIDATAALQSLAAVDQARALVELFGQAPPPLLRSGGLGIRELRRLGRDLGTDDQLTALFVELLAATGMIFVSDAAFQRSNRLPPSWVPTGTADLFLEEDVEDAWVRLATGWLDLRRDAQRVGRRDGPDQSDKNAKVINALTPEAAWARGPGERRFVLRELAALPSGTGLTESSWVDRLAWRAPLRARDGHAALLAGVRAEATALGVIAFDALSTAGRAVLDGDADTARAALTTALPPAGTSFLVQADLTVVAPGRLEREVAAQLARVADVESAGGGTVYRVTAASLRRAFDSGMSAADVQRLFTEHSATGVPQGLSYLIDDVGRSYGVLRLGAASAYLRSDDPALLDQAEAHAAATGVALRRLAPTVAVSPLESHELLAVLRGAGLVAAAEDETGAVVDLRPRPARGSAGLDGITGPKPWREPPVATDEQLQKVVDRMRTADRSGPRLAQQSGEIVDLVRGAAADRRPLWIGYVDTEGSATHRVIDPVAVSGGAVVAFDHLRGAIRTLALHRITDARLAGPDDD
ncbi:helicase C-terminal domain-containing protein [Nakamurella leprariae]|uniref:Helicase C-terminal domain-containing protein n=1 Tax=Nakamurella leprariae TaxID=2803911 RepID=A0A938YB86_9ACTN|nr:helicase C-terminal domain-containing protein [Nakamurella leprariae]MBM9466438.1 helicase C-terminal domain-containing protein [Nakamurella leprariae]